MGIIGKQLRENIKKTFLRLTKNRDYLKPGIKCDYVWEGNAYGGFYVCPKFLDENSVVYSFGIGQDISFDRTLSTNYDCQIFGFDPTPKSINWIKEQDLPKKFNFHPYGIGTKSGMVDFYLPKNPDHVSGSMILQSNVNPMEKVPVQMRTFKNIVTELDHTHIDVLKMDIEGAEYEVINDILDSGISITQLLIEFHDRMIENGKLKTKKVIDLLRNRGYEIFAVSDSDQEVSFINKHILNTK